jgi:glycosyltransferase involved in cell wall biosynthesis
MRILWAIHLYPPIHNCGAEYAAHFVNKFLQDQGHEVRVIIMRPDHKRIKYPYVYDGVEVFAYSNPGDASNLPQRSSTLLDPFRWADIIFSHLDFNNWALNVANMLGKQFVHFVHSSHVYERMKAANAKVPVAAVYNANWVEKELNYSLPHCTIYPPCDPNYYNVSADPSCNEFITLINLNENKGGNIFYEIAKAMPERRFLGVKGSYDEQIIKDLPNVTIVENTAYIREHYKRTRILLMPSEYESWGRTATEAMASGIPVLHSNTPGLKENVGFSGIPIKRDDIKAWVKRIRELDDPKKYKAASNNSRKRAAALWSITQNQLLQFHELLLGLVYGSNNL